MPTLTKKIRLTKDLLESCYERSLYSEIVLLLLLLPLFNCWTYHVQLCVNFKIKAHFWQAGIGWEWWVVADQKIMRIRMIKKIIMRHHLWKLARVCMLSSSDKYIPRINFGPLFQPLHFGIGGCLPFYDIELQNDYSVTVAWLMHWIWQNTTHFQKLVFLLRQSIIAEWFNGLMASGTGWGGGTYWHTISA